MKENVSIEREKYFVFLYFFILEFELWNFDETLGNYISLMIEFYCLKFISARLSKKMKGVRERVQIGR